MVPTFMPALACAMPIDSPKNVEVVRTHLELRDLGALRPAVRPLAGSGRLAPERLDPHAYRAMYSEIGEQWHWRDRLRLSDDALDAYFSSPNVHLWTLRVGEDLAGYFELQRYADRRVEIMYFGLAPGFIGRGLGGWLLTRAAEEAFALGADRVTLHTCTLDSPRALPNYLARGFVIVREERYMHDLAL